MKKHASLVALTLSSGLLIACGEGAVPFKDVETGRYEIKVGTGLDASEPSDSTFPLDSDPTETSDPEMYAGVVEAALNEDGTLADEIEDDSRENGIGEDGEETANGRPGRSASASDGSSVTRQENQKTAALCGKLFAGKANKVKIISAGEINGQMNLDADTILAARLSGNQETLDIQISGIESLAGICIIATGNQPKVSIRSDINVGQLVYLARGNQSSGVVSFLNEHTLATSFVDLRGNGHTLSFVGTDDSHCENAKSKGNANHAVNCL